MNGVATRVPAPGVALSAAAPHSNGGSDNPSGLNAVRISSTCENLFKCAQSNHPVNPVVFGNLCISLSRGVDFALTNNEIPAELSSLLKVCKLVCQRRSDHDLQAPVMVLMLSMKHACMAQWFSAEESQEILALAEEVSRIFNTHEGVSSELTNINPTISQIMSRYYPRIKVVHVLACVDIKPGFEACAVGFNLAKKPFSNWRIRLLVARKDKIDTSSCIITPPKVNILINGRGVHGRMIGQMDLGPQLPTDVSRMLKYGTNLLQAVGDFDAHYTFFIAFMSGVPLSSLPVPEDYAQPASVTLESDAEVAEGPSVVSLNCPFSFTRIKMPAKGMLCKHFQCFDFSNYVEINTRCPLWKCPHCNQPLSYPDIRIDRKMSKILQEVAETAVSVIIHSDGSFEAVSDKDDHNKDDTNAEPNESLQERSDQPLPPEIPNEPSKVYDLTDGDDDNIVIIDVDDDMPEETKPVLQSDLMGQSVPSAAGNSSQLNRSSATQIQDFLRPGPFGNSSGHADHSTGTTFQPVGGINPIPALTESVTPAVMQRLQTYTGTNQQSSPRNGVPSASNAMQLQQTQLQQTESVYREQFSRIVNRVPNAVQAPPVQRPRSNPMGSTRPVLNNSSGISSALNNFSANTSPMNNLPQNASLPSTVLNSTTAARRDTVQQPQILNSQQHLTAQMRNLTSPGQVSNQPRPSTPIQAPKSSSLRPQVTNQPRTTTPVQTHNTSTSNSPHIANQPRSTTPAQVSNNNPVGPHSPQITNQPRSILSVEIPNESIIANSIASPQIANQTRPQIQSPPYMISTPPHLRGRNQVPPGGSANFQQYRPILPPPSATSAQQASVPRTRQLPTTPIQIQTSRVRPASAPSAVSGQPGRTVVSRTQDLVDVPSSEEQNWQPSGRMRGSITGRVLSENFSQSVIRPTHETTPNPFGPHGPSASQPNPSQNING